MTQPDPSQPGGTPVTFPPPPPTQYAVTADGNPQVYVNGVLTEIPMATAVLIASARNQ